MATLNPENPFQLWILSDQETLQGSILTSLQRQVIQNQIAYAALTKLNIAFDPQNPQLFLQEEALYKGKMQALEALLIASSEAESKVDPGLQKVHINPGSNLFNQSNPPQE
jgi:hypothetical protein